MNTANNHDNRAAELRPETGSSPSETADEGFCLLWTIGFSGKRFFSSDEAVIRKALGQAVDFLCREAKKQGAQLTAVSSLARGGDVLFAETILRPDACGLSVQWKCLLPFQWDAFIDRDLAMGSTGQSLPVDERKARMDRAEACRRASVPPAEVTAPNIDPADDEQREEAFLDCGYRTVDEADVLIVLLQGDEIAALMAQKETGLELTGTIAVASYALAARRPMIFLPVDSPDPWRGKSILNDPTRLTPPSAWFVDPMITDVVHRAKELGLPANTDAPTSEIVSERGNKVWQVQLCLEHLADARQSTTLVGLRRVLRFHLAASALAALMATVFAFHELPVVTWLLIPLVLLAFMKPLLAFSALWLEHQLHHRGAKQDWVHARVLAELCRGALAMWPLPIQPLDANDEEDFPKVKRLIRSLRLLREQDAAAGTHGTPRLVRETQLEADMRAACRNYIRHRLLHQAKYDGQHHSVARRQAAFWRMGFVVATCAAIIAGLTLAVHKSLWALGNHFLSEAVEHWMEALVIISPFVAAHCLGMMTIHDCRRRENRYAEMRHYLTRLADTLEKTEANPSRIRLIEHAERMMIEEQHEWFSVMRNLNV